MPQPKSLVCFIEGNGDESAVPALARRVLRAIGANDALAVDPDPWKARGLGKLLKDHPTKRIPNWQAWLHAAGLERVALGAVLLAIDGDESKPLTYWKAFQTRFKRTEFCAPGAAILLAEDARIARAGDAFSVAVVFVVKEFEVWLLAGIESLRGHRLADGSVVPMTASCPVCEDLEELRDAKGILRTIVPSYSETGDQGPMAAAVKLYPVLRRCRSFRRFWHACRELRDAVRNGQHVSTPVDTAKL